MLTDGLTKRQNYRKKQIKREKKTQKFITENNYNREK